MRTVLAILLCGTICSTGCMQRFSTEQRVVELPADDPNTSLETAAQIGQKLVASGLAADIQKQFPNLTPEQMRGLYLTWNAGVFQGKKSIFFLTGIRYTGSLPDAKAVADYCESRVRQAVATRFSAPAKKE
jgi:hypothetical protein